MNWWSWVVFSPPIEIQYWYPILKILKILKIIINKNTKGRGWGTGWSVGRVEGSGEGLGCSQDSGENST